MSKEKKSRVPLVLVAIAVVAGLAWYLLRPTVAPAPTPEKPVAISPGVESRESDEEFSRRVPATEIRRDAKGVLQLGPQFLEIFDAFRARYVGQGEQKMYAAFAEWAEARYVEEEARYLLDVFAKYIEYLKALGEPGLLTAAMTVAERVTAMKALRERIFGKEVSDLLFGAMDARFEIAIRLDAITRDETLTDEEKRAALEEFKNSLDEETREHFFPANPHQEYREKLGELRADESLSEEERAAKTRALREDMFGAEAADRLEALDEERAARTERIGEYWRAAEQVEFDSSLTDEERAARLKALQEEMLTEEDVRRIEAREATEKLERMNIEDIAERIRAQQEGEAPAPDWDSPEQRGENVPGPETDPTDR